MNIWFNNYKNNYINILMINKNYKIYQYILIYKVLKTNYYNQIRNNSNSSNNSNNSNRLNLQKMILYYKFGNYIYLN
jgi:hypothetical protein